MKVGWLWMAWCAGCAAARTSDGPGQNPGPGPRDSAALQLVSGALDLSLAFHPGYALNGRFFVYFTDRHGDTRVVRYRVSAEPDVADTASGHTILSANATVPQSQWRPAAFRAGRRAGGLNLGWNIMEGNHCYAPSSCSRTGLVPPVVEYSHSDGCSVTGGIVDRGPRVPALRGLYLYGDYCGGWVRTFRYAGGQVTEAREWPALAVSGGLSSFGEDARGDVYVISLSGALYRIVVPSQP